MSPQLTRRILALTVAAATTAGGFLAAAPAGAEPATAEATTILLADSGRICSGSGLPTQPSLTNQCVLNAGEDYVLLVGDRTGPGGVHIQGGRNVTIRGADGVGTITGNPRTCDPATAGSCNRDAEWRDRGIAVYGQTGTVRIEGIHMTDVSDAIVLNTAASAHIEIQDVRMDDLHTWQDRDTLGHTDVIETLVMPASIDIDGLTAESDFTGLSFFYTDADPATPKTAITMSRVNLRGHVEPDTALGSPYDQGLSPFSYFHTLGEPTATTQTCADCWVETGWASNGARRTLQGGVRLPAERGGLHLVLTPAGGGTPFECVTGTTAPSGMALCSTAPTALGRTTGDRISFPAWDAPAGFEDQLGWAGVSWTLGTPPGGDWVPAS